MAPKKPTPFEHPPRADPSSDEEEDQEESGGSEEEEEPSLSQPKITKKSTLPPAAEKNSTLSKKPELKPEESSSDEDGSDSASDSGSGSEVTPPAPDPSVKPISSKPAEDSPKVLAKRKLKKPDAPPAVASAVSVTKSAGKRPAEGKGDGKNPKKSKKVADVEDRQVKEEAKKPAADEEVKKVGEDSKKQLFQRLFSEDDEIAVLKGMLEYSAKKGIDPMDDLNDFHDFVKGSIHVDVTGAQLIDKIKRLKKKYENNARRSKTGVDKTFSKPHEQISYDLSKKIWGFENANATSASNGGFELNANGKGKRTPKPNMTPDQKEKHASTLQIPKDIRVRNKQERAPQDYSSSLFLAELMKSKDAVRMGLSEELLKRGLELLDDEMKARLEERWKNLLVAESELHYQRLGLIRDQVKLSLDAYKNSGH
uniref:Glabrous enhancer-binding protein-like DBD domain-containing protein n=1 Tax=Kalanchoe fedtschenkoi TaxID=63787 RepID=A0A7N0T6I1_KALFE